MSPYQNYFQIQVKHELLLIGENVAIHRWSSFLALQKAKKLSELKLETEPGWTLYEGLKARQIPFRLRVDKVRHQNRVNPAEHAYFELENGSRIYYKGEGGFLFRNSQREEAYMKAPIEVLEFIKKRILGNK